jgi:hypothetical protein
MKQTIRYTPYISTLYRTEENSPDTGDNKLNIEYHVTVLHSVNFVIMTWSIDK